MIDVPSWLPALIRLEDFRGDWNKYIEYVFSVFYQDFIVSQPKFRGCWVRCRRDPMYDGKEAGFWHCTSEGTSEQDRIPDLRRCERIAWVRAVLEHAGEPGVDCWSRRQMQPNEVRWLSWFREEFIVVVAERVRTKDNFRYFQLITAYTTEEDHRKRKLRKEREYYKSINS